MLNPLLPVSQTQVTPAQPPARSGLPASAEKQTGPAVSGPVPASPPPEVLEAVDVAAGVLAKLDARQVELRIELHGGRPRVHVSDGAGHTAELSLLRLLELLDGGSAVDARG